jgi:hypothetical protein
VVPGFVAAVVAAEQTGLPLTYRYLPVTVRRQERIPKPWGAPGRHDGAGKSVRVGTLLAMGKPAEEVAELLAEVIAVSDHPQIAAVHVAPSGPEGWCRLKVGFADGSIVFIGTAR